MTVCGIKYVNLKVNIIKILGTHFSYNNSLTWKKFLNRNIKHSKHFKIRCARNLTLKGKIIISKTLALSKIVYLCLKSNY